MSTTTKFTPGPFVAVEWDCEPRFNDDGNRFWGIKPEKFCAGAQFLEASGWMTEANARLLAAAPELYALAIRAETLLPMLGDVPAAQRLMADLSAALAKARGEA
ncbi:hypothetical protein [Novosphingobium resinovorum]|uniref:Uncharacterized protein n=1 Tax=Novosphingobium resinovorum TaxID=158500 RepID=A0A1D8A2H8_9SPHN|nr:hypothetical protein [Novosphingobium resinovorum]AOR76314.1 hypothetical protein BES08_05730 [Novosphingobium resinovorum]